MQSIPWMMDLMITSIFLVKLTLIIKKVMSLNFAFVQKFITRPAVSTIVILCHAIESREYGLDIVVSLVHLLGDAPKHLQ